MMDVFETVMDHSKKFIAQHGPFEVVKKIDRELHRQIMSHASHFMSAKALRWGEDEVTKHGRALYMRINDAFAVMKYDADMRSNPYYAVHMMPDEHPGDPPQKGSNGWWPWYRKYLKSGSWAKKRALIMGRCNQVCEGCGSAAATQVHHQTYDHVGYEFLFELAGLCRDCHARYHGK